MDPAVSFTVYGPPATAGNKTAFPFQRKGGGLGVRVREGKKDGPPQIWRGRVIEAVQAQVDAGAPMLDGPLAGWVVFFMPKPASSPKRRRTWPDRKPDLSKLLRAIEDPMNGVLIADDARFVKLLIEKRYAADDPTDQRPRALVQLWRAEDLEEPGAPSSREGVMNQQTQETLALTSTGAAESVAAGGSGSERNNKGQGLHSQTAAVTRRVAITLGVLGWFALCAGVRPGWWL